MSSIIYEILPESLTPYFASVPIQKVYELRLRVNNPVVISIASRSFFLSQNGLTSNMADAIVVSRNDLETIMHKASDYSLYAVNDQLKSGFITIRGGVRIGICGEVVSENGAVSTIKNIQSLNIRVPHQVRGCSYQILPYVFGQTAPLKTLIISPPGMGKTTMLRDLAWQLCDKYNMPNVLVLDERGEIAANWQGENQLDVGAFTDVLTGCTKSYGFENGIRSMRPDVIITDELATRDDIDMIRTAARSGVCVLASVHARNIEDIRNKPTFRDLIDDQVFDRYVVLTTKDTAGAVVGVFDKNLKLMVM
jgi:stage III sporulation protein AA